MFNLFNSSASIGIDINDKRLRAVQIRKKRNAWGIEKLAVQALPPNVIIHGQIQRQDDFVLAIEDLCQSFACKKAVVAIALPAYLIKTKRLELPKELTNEALERAIHIYLKEELKMEYECAFDFVMQSVASTTHEIAIAFTKKTDVERFTELLASASLKLRVIDIDCYALRRTIASLRVQTIEDDHAILHIRDAQAFLVVFSDMTITYYHSWYVQSEAKLLNDIRDQVTSLRKTIPMITKVLVACSPQFITILSEIAALGLSVEHIKPFEYKSASDQTILENYNDFLIAYGLAMQVFPVW